MQRQDLSCTYLAHHDLESFCSITIFKLSIINIIISTTIVIVVVAAVIVIVNVMQAYAHILGLHSHVLRAIPIFVVYLATLMHVYALARQQVRPLASCPALHHHFATSF